MARTHGPHTMLGAGGRTVEPLSESAELSRLIARLYDAAMNSALGEHAVRKACAEVAADLKGLRSQVAAGYHRNPRRGLCSAGDIVGKIGDDVHGVQYTHADDGEDYEHLFNGEAEVWAVRRNGKRELLVSHRRGLPLWDDF